MEIQSATSHSSLGDDMLRGVKAIAEFLGDSERRTYHMIAKGKLPGVFMLGGRHCARKSTLLAQIARLERGDAA